MSDDEKFACFIGVVIGIMIGFIVAAVSVKTVDSSHTDNRSQTTQTHVTCKSDGELRPGFIITQTDGVMMAECVLRRSD